MKDNVVTDRAASACLILRFGSSSCNSARLPLSFWHGLKITRAQHQSAMATLSTLGDTHRLGYETLAMSVRRLEQRVKELEGRQ